MIKLTNKERKEYKEYLDGLRKEGKFLIYYKEIFNTLVIKEMLDKGIDEAVIINAYKLEDNEKAFAEQIGKTFGIRFVE